MNEKVLSNDERLLIAARLGDVQTCLQLIAVGANVNTQVAYPEEYNDDGQNRWRDEGRTPLMWGIMGTNNPAVVEELLKAGANINAANHHGWTALHFIYSCSSGFPKTAAVIYRLLMQYHPNLEAKNSWNQMPHEVDGFTPKIIPIAQASKEAFDYLDHDKCFSAPARMVSNENGACFTNLKGTIENDWWHRFFSLLIDHGCNPHDLSRQVGGCRIHFLADIPELSKNYFGDFILIRALKKIYYVTYTAKLEEIPVNNYDDFISRLDQYQSSKTSSLLALTFIEVATLLENQGYKREIALHKNEQLINDLKILYARISGKLNPTTLTSGEKISIVTKIAEGATECSSGFTTRINPLVQTLFIPENFYELLYELRKEVVNKVSIEHARGEDHTVTRFGTIASIGFGVPPSNASDQGERYLKDEEIIELEIAAFKNVFQLYPLTDMLMATLRASLGKVSYTGAKTSQACDLIVLNITSDSQFELSMHRGCYVFINTTNLLKYVRKDTGEADDINISTQLMPTFIKFLESQGDIKQNLTIHLTPAQCHKYIFSCGDYIRPDEAYRSKEYVVFSKYISNIIFSGASIKNEDVFVTDDLGYVRDINWDFIRGGILQRILEEKLFKNEYKLIAADQDQPLWVSTEEDIIGFFKYTRLTPRQFIKVLESLFRSAFKPSKEALNKLLIVVAQEGDIAKCDYLLAQGADLNSAIAFSANIDPNNVSNFNTFLKSLKIRSYQEGTFLPHEANSADKRPPELKPYELPEVMVTWFEQLTSLMSAVQSGNDALLDMLLKRGAQVKAVNNAGWTVLHHLAYVSRRFPHKADKMLTRLLAAGADVNCKTLKGHTPSDVASHTEFRQRLLQQELNLAIKAGNLTDFGFIIHKGAEVNIPNQVKRALRDLSQAQLIKEAERQHAHVKRSLEDELSVIDTEVGSHNRELNELLEMNLLAKDTVLSGYLHPKAFQRVESLVATLLQGIFNDYPIYSLANINNESMPEVWRHSITNILKRTTLSDLTQVNQEVLVTIVRAINEEYKDNSIALRVTLHMENEVLSAGEQNHSVREIAICQTSGSFLTMIPAKTCYSAKEHFSELLKNVTLQGGLLPLLILELLKQNYGELTKISNDDLQQLLQPENTPINTLNSFTMLVETLVKQCGHNDNVIMTVAINVLSRLAAFERNKIFTEQEVTEKFNQFRDAYNSTLHTIIRMEYIRRREAKERLQENDPLKQLEKQIHLKEDEIEKNAQEQEKKAQSIASEEAKLKDLQNKAEQVELSYRKQLHEVEEKLKQLKQEQVAKDNELSEMKKKHETNSAKVAEVEKKQADNLALQTSLRAKKEELQTQHAKVIADLENLNHAHENLVTEKDKLSIEKKFAVEAKALAESKRKTLQVLSKFVKQVQEVIINSESIYKHNRKDLRAKLEELRSSKQNQFKELYQYITNIADLAVVKSKEVEDEFQNAELFFHECLDAIEEVLRGCSISFDRDTETFNCKGFNISWNECYAELLKFINEELESYGLKFNDSGHLTVPGYVPHLNDLPFKLRILISERYQANNLPDKLSLPDSAPFWSGLYQHQNLKNLIEQQKYSFSEILPCLVSCVEIVAGNKLHIENDILLAGVDLTIFANGAIHLMPNCKIITSTPNAPEYIYPKAYSGIDYRVGKDPMGRGGDHGLNGLAARSAGHIFIHSNQDIHNLATIVCEAKGGTGGKGQQGGDGDKGRNGSGTPEAETGDCPGNGFLGSGTSYMIVAEARAPGVGENQKPIPGEISGSGGDGGKAGLGGEGGLKGDILIQDFKNSISLVGKEPFFTGPDIGSEPEHRIVAVNGNNGDSGSTNSRGGEAGEAGIQGAPKVKIKKATFSFLFTIWKTDTHRNVDIPAYKQRFKGRYQQKDYGPDYSHKFESIWYCENLPPALGDHTRKSTDKRSRGQDKSHSQNFGLRNESTRNRTNKRTNKTIDQQYCISLQQKAQLMADLKAVKNSEQRTAAEVSKLNAEVTALNNKLTACNSGISVKENQILQAKSAINIKETNKAQIATKLTDISEQIRAIEQEGSQLTAQLLEAIDNLSSIVNDMQKADLASQFARIDVSAQDSIKQKLIQLKTTLSQAVTTKETETLHALSDLKAIYDDLQHLNNIQQQELELLKQEYQLKVEQQEKLKKEVAELDKYIIKTVKQTQQKIVITEQYKAAVEVRHEITDKSNDLNKMLLIDPRDRKDNATSLSLKAMKERLNEIYDSIYVHHKKSQEPIDLLLLLDKIDISINDQDINLLQRTYLSIKDWFLQDNSLESTLLVQKYKKLKYYKLFLEQFVAWLHSSEQISADQLVTVWGLLRSFSKKLFEAHPLLQNYLSFVYKEFCFSLQQRSNDYLCKRAAEHPLTAVELTTFRSCLDDITNPGNEGVAFNSINELAYKCHFYQHFLAENEMFGHRLTYYVTQWPKSFTYDNNDGQVNTYLVAVARLFFTVDTLSKPSNELLYFSICKHIVDQKAKRAIAKGKQEHPPADSIMHYKKIADFIIDNSIDAQQYNSEEHPVARILELLKQEIIEIIPHTELKILKQFKGNQNDFAKALISFTTNFQRIFPEVSLVHCIAHGHFKKFLAKLKLTDAMWVSCINNLPEDGDTKVISILIPFILESIDILNIDNDETTTKALDVIKTISKGNNDYFKTLVDTISRLSLARWTANLVRVKNEFGDDKAWGATDTLFENVRYMLTRGRAGLTDLEHLQRLKTVAVEMRCIDSTIDPKTIQEALKRIQGKFLALGKDALIELAKLDKTVIAAADFYSQVLSRLQQLETAKWSKLFEIMLFCLDQDKETSDDLEKLEQITNLLKNYILKDGAHTDRVEALRYLSQIDNYIDQRNKNKIDAFISACKERLDLSKQQDNQIDEKVKFFESYYRRGQNEAAYVEIGQRDFVKLLITKLQDSNIDFSHVKDVVGLINLINVNAVNSLAGKNLFNLKDNEQNASIVVTKLQQLRAALSEKAPISKIFDSWHTTLQEFIETLQLGNVESWMSGFINDSTHLLQQIIFDTIGNQREMAYRAQQLNELLLSLGCLQVSKKEDIANSERMTFILQVERFSKFLGACAYKTDLYRNIDLLVADYANNNIQSSRISAVERIEELTTSHLSMIFAALRLSGGEVTRCQLTTQLLSSISVKSLLENPVDNLQLFIEKLVGFRKLFDKKIDQENRSEVLVNLFEKTLTNSDVSVIRKALSELYLTLLTNDLQISDLETLVQKLSSHNYSASHLMSFSALMDNIFTCLTRKYLDEAQSVCSKDDTLAKWSSYFANFEDLLQSVPRESFIAITRLMVNLKNPSHDEAIKQIIFNCFGVDKDLETKLYSVIIKSLAADKLTIADAKAMSILANLIPFASNKYQILASSYDCMLTKIQAKDLSAPLFELMISFLVELCLTDVATKIKNPNLKDHLATLVANLASKAKEHGNIRSMAFINIAILHRYLAKADQSIEQGREFFNKLIDAGIPESYLVDNLLNEKQRLYAQFVDKTCLNETVLNALSSDSLVALKQAFWKSSICGPLFGDFYLKYCGNDETLKLARFDDHLKLFIETENFESLEKHYRNLILLISAISNSELKSSFFREMLEIYQCKKQLIAGHSIAVAEATEKSWLDSVTTIITISKKERNLNLINKLLSVSTYLSNPDISHYINGSGSLENKVHRLLIQFLNEAVENHLMQESPEETILLAQFNDNLFATEHGLNFLEIFAKAIQMGNGSGARLLTNKSFNDLVQRLLTVKVYQDVDLINDLAKRPIQYWDAVLKRREIEIKLRLDPRNEQHVQLVENLIKLKKDSNHELFSSWLQRIVTSDSMPIDSLLTIFKRFASRKWKFTQDALKSVTELPIESWEATLAAYFKEKDQLASQVRDAQALTELMRDDKTGINTGVRDLLEREQEATQSEQNLLLHEIVAMAKQERDKLRNEYANKSKAAIKDLIIAKVKQEFNVKTRQGSFEQNFLHKGNIKDLVAFLGLMMCAVEQAEGKEVRDTQCVALICFIRGFDTKQGRLANIATGEGKSLITRMLAIACALRGELVDVVTSSKALAEPNAEEAKALFEYFELKVSNNCDKKCEKDEDERKKRYAENHVLYGEVGSFQRDLLLTDFFAKEIRPNPSNRLIVDEVDSMFIDNTDKVLYISHTINDLKHLRTVLEFIWQCVYAKDTLISSEKNIDLIMKLFQKELHEGTIKVPPHLQSFIDYRLSIWIRNAYVAKNLPEETEYSLLKTGEYRDHVTINDLATGVEQFQSQWSNGLHQFVQLKHQKALSDESLRAIFISNVSYFNRYKESGCINGMSGTLGSTEEQKLLAKIYGVNFFSVPRFKVERYTHEEDIVVGSLSGWQDAIWNDVRAKIVNSEKSDVTSVEEAKTKVNEFEEKVNKTKQEIVTLQQEKAATEAKIAKLQKEIIELNRLIPMISSDAFNGEKKSLEEIKKLRLDKMQQRDEKEVLLKELNESIPGIMLNLTQKDKNLHYLLGEKEDHQSVVVGGNSRAVLIICQDKKTSAELYSLLKERLQQDTSFKHQGNLYLYDSYVDGFKLKTERLQPQDIIVATNIGGRGWDIEISPLLAKNMGLHVINSYMSANIRIEEQAFGRCARKGEPGSGKFIVFDQRATPDYKVSIEQLRDERDELERARLNEILQIKLPRLETEQTLSVRYGEFQNDIKQKLQQKSLADDFIVHQIKSLQDAWAFWFDAHDQWLEQVTLIGQQAIFDEFDTFKATMLQRLNESNEMLIVDPGELMKLAKYHMQKKNFADAVRCYGKVIERDPDFSGFAHYYQAQAIIAAGSNTASKKQARTLLKKSVPLFEAEISRLSTANQLVRLVGNQRQASGKGLNPDLFTKTNIDEMGIYNIHAQAAKEAYGSELRPDTFKNGEAVGNEAKIVFDGLRHAVPEHIKDYRVSKKASIRKNLSTDEEELYYRETKVDFPRQFTYCKKEIMDYLKPITGDKPHTARKVNRRIIDDLIFTTKTLMELLDPHIIKIDSITPHADFSKNSLGAKLWQENIFCGHGEKIKPLLLKFTGRMTKANFITLLKKDIGESTINWEHVCQKLVELEIIKIEQGYSFKDEVATKLSNYCKEIVLASKPDIQQGINNIPLESIAELKPHSSAIRNVLKSAVSTHGKILKLADFTNNNIRLSEELYLHLVVYLREFGLLENRLPTFLGLNSVKPYHKRQLEDAILSCYSHDHFVEAQIECAPKPDEANNAIWSQLVAAHVAKEPAVLFPTVTDSEQLIKEDLKAIKEQVENKINEIIAGIPKLQKAEDGPKPSNQPFSIDPVEMKRREDVDRLKTAICEALEKSIGTLKTIHKVKLENRNLELYFPNKLPPIAIDYINSACADVLNFVLDKNKGFWDWDAFLCAMLGVIQIVAGVLLTYFCPAAAYLGQVLISEGLSDISFAVTSAISGNFSWKAYGEHKALSLAVSLATAGVGAALSGGASAVKEGLNVSATIAKELANAILQVTADVALNMLLSNISENVIASLFDEFKRTFKNQVLAALAPLLESIKQSFAVLYRKLSAKDADAVIQRIIQALNMQKIIEGDVSVKALRAVEAVTNKLAGFKKSGAKGSALQTIGSLAAIVSTILEVESYRKAVTDIVNTPGKLFEEFDASMKQRTDRYGQQDDAISIAQVELDKIVEQKLEQIIEGVLQQIQAQVQQVFMKAGTRGLNAALQPAIEGAKTWLSDSIDQLYENANVKEGQEQLRAIRMAKSPQPKSKISQETGDIFTTNEIENEVDSVMTAAGPQEIDQVKQAAGGAKLFYTAKAGQLYLLERQFSGDPVSFSLADTESDFSFGLNNRLVDPFITLGTPNRYSFFNNNSADELGILAAGYMAVHPSLTAKIKGFHGEQAARLTLQRAKYTELTVKIGANNGFDGIWVKYNKDGTLADVIVSESKYSKTGKVRLKKTESMGVQLSPKWIEDNIGKLRSSKDAKVRAVGDLLISAKEQGILRLKTNVLLPSGVNSWDKKRIVNLPQSKYINKPSTVKLDLVAAPKAVTTPATINTPDNKKLPKGLRVINHGLAALGVYSTASNIYNQYKQDKLTGNYTETYKVAASEAGCWAVGVAGAKVGAYAGSFFPGVGTMIGAAAGGVAGCYIGTLAADKVESKLNNGRP